jgi:hypothetical protein
VYLNLRGLRFFRQALLVQCDSINREITSHRESIAMGIVVYVGILAVGFAGAVGLLFGLRAVKLI